MKKGILFLLISIFFINCEDDRDNIESVIVITKYCSIKDTITIRYKDYLRLSMNNNALIDGGDRTKGRNIESFSIIKTTILIKTGENISWDLKDSTKK